MGGRLGGGLRADLNIVDKILVDTGADLNNGWEARGGLRADLDTVNMKGGGPQSWCGSLVVKF